MTVVTLALDDRVTPALRNALAGLEGVTVVTAPRSALITETAVTPLGVRGLGAHEVTAALQIRSQEQELWLVAGVLDAEAVIALEDHGQPFVDAAGRAWVPGAPRTARGRPLRGRSRAATFRAAQLLADHPDETWSEPRLAERAEIGAATANRLLSVLASEGIVERTGAGRGARSEVRDVRRLRRWLVDQAAGKAQALLPFYVRDPARLPAETDGLRLVRSGAHAAELIGAPVLSAAPRPLLRVEARPQELEDLPARLGGLRTSRGANAVLVADHDRLGALDARQVGEVWTAPPSRICLDLRLEPRGDAAAQVFLDLWGEQIL